MVDDPQDGPRPLPKVQLLSELKGQLKTGRELSQASGRRGAGPEKNDRTPFRAPKPKPGAPGARPQGRKPARKPTVERMWNITLYNVEQREMSSAGLARILSNRVLRYCMGLQGEERAQAEAEGKEAVQATVARAIKERLIDDARFAQMKARSWRNKGWGERRIAMEMRRQGLADELAQDALAAVDADAVDGVDDPDVVAKEANLVAAETLCKRRKIGPYRKVQPEGREDQARVYRREMGVLARAGFSGDVIKDLLGRPPVEGDGLDG